MICLLQCRPPPNTDVFIGLGLHSVLFIQIFVIKSYECETIFHKWSLKDKELHTLSHEILFSQYV